MKLLKVNALYLIGVLLPSSAIALSSESPSVLVLGDSISAAYGLPEKDGWVSLFAEQLKVTHPGATVVNASISGETTGGGLQRLPTALSKFKPNLLIIELGGNDGLRGQSLKKMRQNLSEMVALAREFNARSLILGMRIPSNYGVQYTQRFFDSFKTAADDSGAALVPFLLEPFAADRSFFQPDGVHPTKKAQPLMLDLVLPEVLKLLE